jgi:hypothetical protein
VGQDSRKRLVSAKAREIDRRGVSGRAEDQNASPGDLEASVKPKPKADGVHLIAETSGIGLYEEVTGGRVYGYILAVMPAKNKDFGSNAWYLPNWVLDFALAVMPKMAAELAKPKEDRQPLREVMRAHQLEWKDWLKNHKP